MIFRQANFTSLQRKSFQRMGAVLLLTILTNFSSPRLPNPIFDLFPQLKDLLLRQQASFGYASVLAVISLLPILLAVWIAADYLQKEPDEFVRVLLVRALLWGFAVTMAGDAILSVFTMVYARPFPIVLLNADLFVCSTMIAFRVVQRGYR